MASLTKSLTQPSPAFPVLVVHVHVRVRARRAAKGEIAGYPEGLLKASLGKQSLRGVSALACSANPGG